MIERAIQLLARAVSARLGRGSRVVRVLRPAYERFLAAITFGRGVPWVINGTVYRVDPRMRRYLAPEYDREVFEYISARIRPGDVCLDVGANVGLYVLQFARWTGPNGLVVAFEPNAEAREVLERHARMNGIADRVRTVAAAVADAPGEAPFYVVGVEGTNRLGEPAGPPTIPARTLSVPVVTLDDYCRSEGLDPDWLLIDIEGFEILALEGATELFARRGRALKAVVEMHPNVWRVAGVTRERAQAALAALARRPVPLSGQRDPLGHYGHVALELEAS